MFEKNLNISLLLDFYGDILSDRQKDMLDMYYNDDCSLAEIAVYYEEESEFLFPSKWCKSRKMIV